MRKEVLRQIVTVNVIETSLCFSPRRVGGKKDLSHLIISTVLYCSVLFKFSSCNFTKGIMRQSLEI